MKTTKSKMLKKIIAFFLATLILCSSIPMQVFAAGINLGQQVSRTTINVKAEKKYGHEIHTTKVNGEKPLTVMVKGFCFVCNKDNHLLCRWKRKSFSEERSDKIKTP